MEKELSKLFNKNNFHGHIFTLDNNYYIYDYIKGISLEVTENFYRCVENLVNQIHIDYKQYSKELDLLAKMLEKDIIFSEDNKEWEIDSVNYKNVFLSFAPVYSCNFKCKYCFGEGGKSYSGTPTCFNDELVEKVLDFFFYEAFPEAENYRIDFVSGGEPLLNFNAIKKAVEYSELFQMKSGKKVSIWMCTNGTLINEEICRYLDAHNVSIGISIDGPKDCHNANRVNLNDQGTYDDVIENYIKIKDNNELSSKFKSIWALSVISKENDNIVDIIKHHYDLGIHNTQLKFIRTISNNQNSNDFYKKLKDRYKELSQFILEEFKNENIKYIEMILNDNDYFGKLLKRIMTNIYVTHRCEAGRSKITICPNGDIYPCDSFVGMEEMKIGNIYGENYIKNNQFKEVNVLNRKECKQCSIRYICGGDCYYNSYLNTKNIYTPDEKFCNIIIYLCNLAIKLSIDMQKEDKKRYERICKGAILKNAY